MPENHHFRYDDVGFDGNVKFGSPPKPVSGRDILAKVEGSTFAYGKGGNHIAEVDEKDEVQIWKKKGASFLICSIESITHCAIIWM